MSGALGKVIGGRRREMGLTQEQFAELLGEGVRQSEVSRLERGLVTMPRAERLQRISEVIDVPVGELLMLTSWAEPEPGSPKLPPTPSAVPEPKPVPGMDGAPDMRPRSLGVLMQDARATVEETKRILDSLDRADDVRSGVSNG